MNKRRELEQKKTNYCARFILPMVGVNHNNLPSNFINAYISLDKEAFLIFDKTVDYDIVFYHYLEHVKVKNLNLIECIEQEQEVVLKFAIPEQHSNNYHLFLEGKYSQFDEEYKQVICRYFGKGSIKEGHTVTEYNAIYPQTFKKRQLAEHLYDRKDVEDGLKLIHEVLARPDLDREIYKPIEQLIQQHDATKQEHDTVG